MKPFRFFAVMLLFFVLAACCIYAEETDEKVVQDRLRNRQREESIKKKHSLAYAFLRENGIDAKPYDGNHGKTLELLNSSDDSLTRLSAIYLLYVNKGQGAIPVIWDYFQEEYASQPIGYQSIEAAKLLLELGDLRWMPPLLEEYNQLANEQNVSLLITDPNNPIARNARADVRHALDAAVLFARAGDGRGYGLAEQLYDYESFNLETTMLLGNIALYVPDSIKQEKGYDPVEILKKKAMKVKGKGNIQVLMSISACRLAPNQLKEVYSGALENPNIEEKDKKQYRSFVGKLTEKSKN